MKESKREPPARPQIRKREGPPTPVAQAKRESRDSTIEVEADWLEEVPSVELKPAREPAPRKSIAPKGSSASASAAARKSIAPRASVPPAKSATKAAPSRAKVAVPRIRYVDESGATTPPGSLARPRGKLAPTIPREEEESEHPPPRRRSKPPTR